MREGEDKSSGFIRCCLACQVVFAMPFEVNVVESDR